MDKTRTVGTGAVKDHLQSERTFTAGPARGIVHTFVEIDELRQLMARLTAVELIRMMLEPDGSAHSA
jgi:hypothetical protein